MTFTTILLSLMVMTGLTLALDTYQQRCTEGSSRTSEISPNGASHTISTQDSCDSSKLLACRGGRCECADQINHIFTSLDITTKQTTLSRKKRSPKGKKWLKAAIGGSIIGVAGYKLGKYIAKSQKHNNVHHIVVSDQNVASDVHREYHSQSVINQNNNGNSNTVTVIKTETVFGCYSRVHSDCVLDRTRPSYTQEKITNVSPDGSSVTTVITKHVVDYNKYPLCIPNAKCRPKTTFTAGQDSNIGECVCQNGYMKTGADICVRASG